jgi:hypothetical protein
MRRAEEWISVSKAGVLPPAFRPAILFRLDKFIKKTCVPIALGLLWTIPASPHGVIGKEG